MSGLMAALERLNELIDLGWEYADAEFKAARECRLHASEHVDLRAVYDAQFAK